MERTSADTGATGAWISAVRLTGPSDSRLALLRARSAFDAVCWAVLARNAVSTTLAPIDVCRSREGASTENLDCSEERQGKDWPGCAQQLRGKLQGSTASASWSSRKIRHRRCSCAHGGHYGRRVLPSRKDSPSPELDKASQEPSRQSESRELQSASMFEQSDGRNAEQQKHRCCSQSARTAKETDSRFLCSSLTPLPTTRRLDPRADPVRRGREAGERDESEVIRARVTRERPCRTLFVRNLKVRSVRSSSPWPVGSLILASSTPLVVWIARRRRQAAFRRDRRHQDLFRPHREARYGFHHLCESSCMLSRELSQPELTSVRTQYDSRAAMMAKDRLHQMPLHGRAVHFHPPSR